MSLEPRINNAIASRSNSPAQWAVSVIDSETGEKRVGIADDEELEAASLNKLAIPHVLDLTEFLFQNPKLRIEAEEQLPGTGILKYFPPGYEIPLLDATYWMLAESDNTAARMVVRSLGGPGRVNEILADSPLKLAVTKLEPLGDEQFYFGSTTAYETALLLRAALFSYYRVPLANSHAWYGLRRDIDEIHPLPSTRRLRFLKLLQKAKLNGFAPHSWYDKMLDAYREPSKFPSKEGSFEDVRHDSAQIGEVIIAALSKGYDKELSYGPQHPAHEVHRCLGKIVLNHADEA